MKIYLDNSATTKIRKEVLNTIIDINENFYGNPSSLHKMGLQIEKKIENARKIVSNFVNANTKEIIFTSGGTESNNLAIFGHLSNISENTNIITTRIEHPSVYNVFKNFEKKGIKVNYLDCDKKGRIDLLQLDSLVDDNTKLISIIYVNNEIGIIQDVSEILRVVRKKNNKTKIHIDGIQAFGKIKIDLKKLDIDSMSFSSHKIHGPKGIGGLYINSRTNIKSIFLGGNQEKGLRAGTENTAGIVGFGKAVDLIDKEFDANYKKTLELKNIYAKKIKSEIEDTKINSLLNEESAPHILNVSFKNVRGEVLLHFLEKHNIYVSTGSACSSKSKTISRTLESIDLENSYQDGTIRISFGYFNKLEELDYVIDKIKKSVNEIRQIIC